MMRTLPLVLIAVLAAFAFIPASASAQSTVIESSTIENGYPQTLTFKVTARADVPINDVTLRYSIKGRGTSALAKPDDPISPATVVSAEIELDVNSSQAYIPVGSEFTYHWEIQTSDGNVLISPDETFLFLPPDKAWQEVSNDFMVVHYHGDRQSIAESYLRAGTDTYQRIGRDLYGIELTNLPVRVILFADENESNLARPGTGGSFDAAVLTCGTKVTNDILLVIPEGCGSADITDVMRHELGHILNEVAGEGTIAKLPSWLDEGAAVYAQTTPGDYERAFNAAVNGNRLIPFNQMGTPTNDASRVGIFYGQSYFMVRYLIDREGPETFAEFMATIKRGTRFDQALEAVYGFDLAGFEDEFRSSLGLAPIAQPKAAPTQAPQQQEPQPTVAPTRAPQQGSGGGGSERSLGTGTFVIFGVAILFALAAVFSYLVAAMLGNNRVAATAPSGSTAPAPAAWTPPAAAPQTRPAWTLPSKDEAPRYVPPLAAMPPEFEPNAAEPATELEPAVDMSSSASEQQAVPSEAIRDAPAEADDDVAYWARKRDESRQQDS